MPPAGLSSWAATNTACLTLAFGVLSSYLLLISPQRTRPDRSELAAQLVGSRGVLTGGGHQRKAGQRGKDLEIGHFSVLVSGTSVPLLRA